MNLAANRPAKHRAKQGVNLAGYLAAFGLLTTAVCAQLTTALSTVLSTVKSRCRSRRRQRRRQQTKTEIRPDHPLTEENLSNCKNLTFFRTSRGRARARTHTREAAVA